MTFENNMHVSGGGHRLHQEWQTGKDFHGAIAFLTNGVTIAGNVELVADNEMSSLGEGPFKGTISGDRLVAKPGTGRIVFAANNTYTGGTEIVRTTIALAGASPSLGTGMVSLDNGVLRFENTAPITFSNEIEGVGRIEVAGAPVKFTSPGLDGLAFKSLAAGSSFDYPGFTNPVYVVSVEAGGLDLGGRDATVAGIAGSGRVSGGVLTVTGEINPAGAGAVGVLTFEKTPVLSGVTYVCDLVGESADRIEFEADIDISGLAFQAVRNGRYSGQYADVLVSSGEVSGPFASATLPPGKYSLVYGESAVTLKHPIGGVISFRG
jgi:autotransporter-associated beta strand protein